MKAKITCNVLFTKHFLKFIAKIQCIFFIRPLTSWRNAKHVNILWNTNPPADKFYSYQEYLIAQPL
jgi:hypothetical protein